MRVAVYMSVSTLEQSTDLQRDECLAFIQGRGFLPPRIFEDIGISGDADYYIFDSHGKFMPNFGMVKS
jgi:DNA invertase Pin-like site-specific DNA recombinase